MERIAQATEATDSAKSIELGRALFSCSHDPTVAKDCPPRQSQPVASLPELQLAGLDSVQPVRPGETDHVRIKIDGDNRDVYLHLPANADPNKPMPLMIVYNGLNTPGGAGGMDRMTQLGKEADEKGFAVAFLQGGGIKGGWNNGQLPFDHQDDVKFTNNVIDTLQSDLNIDKDRTYLIGISWGGSMMHKAVSQLSDKVAGVVDIAGFMTGKEKWKDPDSHVSELTIHSKDDPTVYYTGRTGWGEKITGFQQEPTPNTFEFYRRQDGITGEPTTTTSTAPDGKSVTTKDSVNPVDGTEVKMITLDGVGHGWPGGYELPNTINATDEAVNFLLSHSRRPAPHSDVKPDVPISGRSVLFS
jgi:polyhydroxybutyrate depolymerase